MTESPKPSFMHVNTDNMNIDKTVIETAEELQLALGSLKQVICLNIFITKILKRCFFFKRDNIKSCYIL